MKYFLIKIGIYGLICFLILNVMAYLSLFFLEKSNFYKPQFVANNNQVKHFDYVVLGSSTGLTTLDTKQIDAVTKLKGLNISMDDSALSSHFLMLQHFLATKKTTKKLVLVVTPWDLENEKERLNDNDYRFLPHIQNDYVFHYFNSLETSYFKPSTLSKYLPIVGVSYYNAELFFPSIIAAFQPNKRNRFDEKGNYSYPMNGNPTEIKNKTTLLSIKNPVLKKIQNYCTQKNIQLLLYIAPIYNTKVINKSPFFIYNHSDFCKDKTLFYDSIHVNQLGRAACSFDFSRFLIHQK